MPVLLCCSLPMLRFGAPHRGFCKLQGRRIVEGQTITIFLYLSTGQPHPLSNPTTSVGTGVGHQPRLDLTTLEREVLQLIENSVAPSTRRTYRSAQNRYLSFCQLANVIPFPVSTHILCQFVAFLGSQGVKHQSAKSYLSAVRHAQITAGFQDPFRNADLSRLECVLKGLKRQQACQGTPAKTRLPITPDILRSLKQLWDPSASNQDVAMLWAACTLGFFGFLRCGEFTCPSRQAYDPSCHLSLEDVAIDSPTTPSIMRVTLKQSKTDPFRQGVDIFLGATKNPLCPVMAMLAYLAIRGSAAGPLFIRSNGSPLTRSFLVDSLKTALSQCGIDPAKYNGHSFRIGAATTAAACGIPDATIKMLGRWQSSAYSLYIRTPRAQLASIASRLAAV